VKYPGQIAIASLTGISAAVITSGSFAFSIGLIVFVVTRYSLAVVGRTRYWYYRGGRQRYHCPNCNKARRRLSGDWIMRCRSCGWTPGIPGLRLLTRGAHIGAMRHSITIPLLVVVLLAFALPVFQAGLLGVSTGSSSELVVEDRQLNTTTVGSSSEITVEERRLNITKVEQLIVEYTNANRTKRSVSAVVWDPNVADRARAHSEYMVAHGYTRHAEPKGIPLEERYTLVCSVDGENVATVLYDRETRSWASGQLITLRTEEAVARELVAEWLKSYGHHQNMMNARWERIGVGVAINRSSGDVYATQTFCEAAL